MYIENPLFSELFVGGQVILLLKNFLHHNLRHFEILYYIASESLKLIQTKLPELMHSGKEAKWPELMNNSSLNVSNAN